MQSISIALTISILAPLVGAAFAGICGTRAGNRAVHWATICGLLAAFVGASYLFIQIVLQGAPVFNTVLYTWGTSQGFQFNIGFLVDQLTAVMLLTVTFVSLLVHIYSMGYMQADPGYARFFAYMSLFTFFMLLLVTANNFLLLFFGWEGVGLVSYLLIGFWFQREAAAQGSLKAFLVNRVGDAGFLLGIAAILAYCNTLDYMDVFQKAPLLSSELITIFPNHSVSFITLTCVLLFIGAMGKSAQVPLHVWLPESMEGPTPISALIHAATMVTAGVYMVARFSPLFEYSQVVLSLVLVAGATGALFLGMVALVQTDIKRVIAYSTLSQLGYMMAANGVSAFSASIFHLMTHAGFKALLFLCAGSVILAMHHEQDMRKMGGLRKQLPITYVTFLIGALALAAIPPFSGFYSKEAIIEAVHLATIPGANYAYICLLLGTFVTALYIFRALFLVFHAQPRFGTDTLKQPHEPAATITVPLIILAVPTLLSGAVLAYAMLYDVDLPLLGNSVVVAPAHHLFKVIAPADYVLALIMDAPKHLPLWFSIAGIFSAWVCYTKLPQLPIGLRRRFSWLYAVLTHKYGFDAFNERVFVRGSRRLSGFFFHVADVKLIDGILVNGLGHSISRLSTWARRLQSGYVYHYALAVVAGLFAFLVWLLIA